jgi:ubiquinone/menaquinone biosynthesis C-methylase UbiE
MRADDVSPATPDPPMTGGAPADAALPELDDPNAELFDAYASGYANTVNASIAASGEDVAFFARRKADEVARWLRAASGPRPRSVLDFGCGTGLSTAALAAALPSAGIVTGVDVSPESVRQARRVHRGDRLRFVEGDARVLPFDDGAFDLVFTACVFHHIERELHVHWARELARVLRPGGVLFLFEHNPRNPLTVRAVRACPFDQGVVLLPPAYAREVLDAAGLVAQRPRFYFFFPAPLRRLRPLEPTVDRVPLGAQYFVAARRP